ncbi:metallophosphoesterase family protein [Rubinisphaera margarita]|uniref:metallophosphoesterase family protein n=1 Tax=Rubinisphaera margarita TaxID=2909586 RepID=UPI001EE7924E|nr:metallophosphoesterase family protein [Rubinisphaera margarita]MCG6156005.1 metallophosphatase family protein [Rubinisphaera margarita]
MRILILSDIHSNWTALQAIHRQEPEFDACLVLGDLVEFGPQPREVIDWVRRHATHVIRGNHDHAVAQFIHSRREQIPWHRLRNRMRDHHWGVIEPEEMSWLAQLPLRVSCRLDGKRFHLIHASPRDPLHEYLPDHSAIWQKRTGDLDTDLLCVGHTHRPLLLKVGTIQLVNPGSAGQSRDGQLSASYAVIDSGHLQLKRVDYDLSEMLAEYERAGIDEETCEIAREVYSAGFFNPES